MRAAFDALTQAGTAMSPVALLCAASSASSRARRLRFVNQRGRFVSALVRPLVWLLIFAAGFHFVLGVSIIPPYDTYVPYEVYIAPGLIGMIQLFQGMQSSLSMVYDREMGSMRTLLVSPLPRWYLLVAKLLAGVIVSVLQAYVFLAIARFWEIEPPAIGLSHGAAGADALRHDAGGAGPAAVLGDPAAGEFRRRDELRDLPDVLRLLGALPAVARAGGEPAALSPSAASTPSPMRSSSSASRFTASSIGSRRRWWRGRCWCSWRSPSTATIPGAA